MLGRMDVIPAVCRACNGTGNDKRKRTRPCPTCQGAGKVPYCKTCKQYMPCPGTSKTVLDQTYCDCGPHADLRKCATQTPTEEAKITFIRKGLPGEYGMNRGGDMFPDKEDSDA
jgi:RecJ-like exonuclease